MRMTSHLSAAGACRRHARRIAGAAALGALALSAHGAAAGELDAGHGVSFSLQYTGQAAANPSGGVRQDEAFAGQLYFGTDVDLAELANLAGGSVHLAITNRHGDNLAAKAIGNNTSVQEIFGGGQTTRLTKLSYRQKLFQDRLDVEVGRLVANTDFLSSDLYCHFQTNSACGNPTFVFKTSNFTYWPVSSWGGHAKLFATDKIFLHAGVYEVNPDRVLPGDHGLKWSTEGATGVVIPVELGYATTFENDAMPRHYGVGGWYDTSDYSDPLRDVAGGASVVSGLPSLTRSGRSGVYARFDQMVWRPDPASERGVTLFGVAMAGTSGKLIESSFFELGALWRGPLASRPDDTIGLVANVQRFSDRALRRLELAQASIGNPRDLPRHQVMMELNYGFQPVPGLSITPNLQYVVNPDQQGLPFRRKSIPDAFVFGVNLKADLFTLAGLGRAKTPRPAE